MFAVFGLAGRWRLVLVAAVGVVVLLAVLGAARHDRDPVAEVRRTAVDPGAPEGTQRPVLLVTGYGGDTGPLTALRDALRAAGRDADMAPPLGHATGDIPDQARHLAAVVDRALARTGATSLDVVGMSLGGVVVRSWVADFGGGAVAHRVVTLGSPHHGVDLAALGHGCPVACRQLTPGSGFLRRLNRDETPPGPSWVSLRSASDDIVPPWSSPLAGALSFSVQSVCPGLTVDHEGLLTTPAVQRMVVDLLAGGRPAVPPATVCS